MGKVCEIEERKSDRVLHMYYDREVGWEPSTTKAYVNCEVDDEYWHETWLSIEATYRGSYEERVTIGYNEAIALANFILSEAKRRGHIDE